MPHEHARHATGRPELTDDEARSIFKLFADAPAELQQYAVLFVSENLTLSEAESILDDLRQRLADGKALPPASWLRDRPAASAIYASRGAIAGSHHQITDPEFVEDAYQRRKPKPAEPADADSQPQAGANGRRLLDADAIYTQRAAR